MIGSLRKPLALVYLLAGMIASAIKIEGNSNLIEKIESATFSLDAKHLGGTSWSKELNMEVKMKSLLDQRDLV